MKAKILSHFRLLYDDRYLASSSIIFAGSFIVNVLNYIFTIVMSRLLSVEDFGEVAALLSLFLIISVPATALTMLMAREAAYQNENSQNKVKDLFVFIRKHAVIASIILWILFLIVAPLLSSFLKIHIIPLFIFSLLVPLVLNNSLFTGTLQGLQEFLSLAKLNVLGTITKLVAGILLVVVGYSVAGVMVALVIASLTTIFYGYFITKSLLFNKKYLQPQLFEANGLTKIFGSILLTTFLIALLSNVDVLLVKHFLTAELAGQYGALSTVGKILIYGVGAFIVVLLPMASAAHAKGEGKERHILKLSLVVVAVASVAAYIVFSIFPHIVVGVLFGVRYAPIEEYLGMFVIAMGFIALSTTLINYFVAIRNTTFLYLLAISIAIEAVLIYLYHDALSTIVYMMIASSAILFGLLALNAAYVSSNYGKTLSL